MTAAHGWATEAEMAVEIISFMESAGWDCYQEVEFHGGIADIVGVKDGFVWVVECKLTFSFASLDQGLSWRKYADLVSLGVPDYERCPGRRHRFPEGWGLGFSLARNHNLGILTASSQRPYVVRERLHAINNDIKPAIRNQFTALLRPEHKTWAAAGSPTGARFTPFKGTCELLRAYILAHPGCTLSEATKVVKHHYRTAGSFKTCMKKLIARNAVRGVRFSDESGKSDQLVALPDSPPVHLGPASLRAVR